MDTLNLTKGIATDSRLRDRRHVWHPWSPATVDRGELMLVKAAGIYVYDADDRQYIDCSSLNSTVGFSNHEVIDAVSRQSQLNTGTDISIASHNVVGELSERLAGYLPETMSRSLFVNSGSEAIDASVFIATSYWLHAGQERKRFVSFRQGYHGSTLASRTLTGLPRVVHPFDAPFKVTHVDLPFAPRAMRSEEALEALIDRFEQAIGAGDDLPAAVIVEPLLNVGGAIVLPDQFLARLAELCRAKNTLLIVDEVFTAYGRCGAMYASFAMGAQPDILVSSKGLASGYCPIAALSATDEICDSFAKDAYLGGLRYGHTTSGHAPACAAALATLDILERDGLAAHAGRTGETFRRSLAHLVGQGDVVDIRGLGLANAIEFTSYEAGAEFVRRMRDRGVLLRQPNEAVIVSPPLIFEDADLAEVVSRIEDALGTAL